MNKLAGALALCLLSTTATQAQWQTLNTSNSPLHSNVVREVAIDTDGSKWIATQQAVQKLSGSTWSTYTAANGPAFSNVACVAARNGIVWVGSNQGLHRFDGSTWTTYNDPAKLPVGLFGPNDLTVTEVVVTQTGTVWLAGSRGVARFDGSTWTRFHSGNSGLQEDAVTSLALDEGANTLWIGTNCNSARSGVYAINLLNNSFRYQSTQSANCVHGVAVGSTGTVFVGSCNQSGLLTIDNGVLGAFTASSCVALDGLAPDPTNPQRVWVATESIGSGGSAPRGLLVYDGSAVVQQFNVANSGLPSNLLSSVTLEQNGGQLKAWVGTADKGLATYEAVVSSQRPAQPRLSLQALPNPATSSVEVSTDQERYTLAVYDNAGRLQHQQQVRQAGPLRLAVQSWPTGLYHLRVNSAAGTAVTRFVKE